MTPRDPPRSRRGHQPAARRPGGVAKILGPPARGAGLSIEDTNRAPPAAAGTCLHDEVMSAPRARASRRPHSCLAEGSNDHTTGAQHTRAWYTVEGFRQLVRWLCVRPARRTIPSAMGARPVALAVQACVTLASLHTITAGPPSYPWSAPDAPYTCVHCSSELTPHALTIRRDASTCLRVQGAHGTTDKLFQHERVVSGGGLATRPTCGAQDR